MVQEIGVRALREQLSQVLESVQAGRSVLVTHNHKPIARIEPVHAEASPAVQRLLGTGRVTWGGERLRPFEPVALAGDGPTVSEILLAQRGEKVRQEGPRRRPSRALPR